MSITQWREQYRYIMPRNANPRPPPDLQKYDEEQLDHEDQDNEQPDDEQEEEQYEDDEDEDLGYTPAPMAITRTQPFIPLRRNPLLDGDPRAEDRQPALRKYFIGEQPVPPAATMNVKLEWHEPSPDDPAYQPPPVFIYSLSTYYHRLL